MSSSSIKKPKVSEYTVTTVITSEPTTNSRMATTTVSSTSVPTSSQPRATFRDLCALFCCPPLPSSIVAKLAFMPPEPSYRILTSDTGRFVEGFFFKLLRALKGKIF